MFADPDDPFSADVFFESWAMEIRAGFTPLEELDLMERLDEYLPPDVPADVEAPLVERLVRETEALTARAREEEAGWAEPTENDRLTAAFEAMRGRGLFAKEGAGLTIQDGWGYVGVEAPPGAAGAVFYHQQDVFDALRGEGLLLAFGVAGPEAGSPDDARRVAEQALDVLAAHGLEATWSGEARDRIALSAFPWRRRRFTSAPDVGAPGGAPTPVPWRRVPRQGELFAPPSADALLDYVQPVVAYRTTYAFDAQLGFIMRGAWRARFHGERGQVAHHGPPHAFVRAGEETSLVPCDGTSNLDPDAAAALRRRGIAARPPSEPPGDGPAPRPWWRLWG